MEIKILQQIITEDNYNLDNLKENITEELKDKYTGKVNISLFALEHYKNTEYKYESKNRRMKELTDFSFLPVIWSALAVIASTDAEITIQTVVGGIETRIPHEELRDRLITSGEILAVMCETDLFDIIAPSDSETGSLRIKSNMELSESLKNKIVSRIYMPPMVSEPLKVTSNVDTSHLTFKNSLILGRFNHHKKPLALDVINTLNKIPLALDLDILDLSEKPSKEPENVQTIKQFKQLAKESVDVYNYLLENDNKFYLTWKFDKRGRIYSQGYQTNLQSFEYKKALISLNKKELL